MGYKFANSAIGEYQGGSTSDTARWGFSPAPGKEALTTNLPAAMLWDQEAERAIGRADQCLDGLSELIQAAKSALEAAQFQEAKAAIGKLESKLVEAQDNAGRARGILGQKGKTPENSVLLEKLDMVVQRIQSAKEDVAPILARKPPESKTVPFSMPGTSDEDANSFDAWQAEQAVTQESWERMQVAINSLPPDEREPVGYEQESCRVRGPVAPNAVEGIHLFAVMKDQLGERWGSTVTSSLVGPGLVGPYDLMPMLKEGKITGFLAFHKVRQWPEWVVGPDSVDDFVDQIDYFVGAARANLPGSPHLPDSMKDGADRRAHDPSVVELEAFNKAPWQKDPDAGPEMEQLWGPPKEKESDRGLVGVVWDLFTQGLDDANGGNSAVNAWNSHVRLTDYIGPAEEMRDKLLADVRSGKISHMDGRHQGVDGRNDLMRNARKKMSKSAQYASEKIKADKGISEPEMVKRKIPDILMAAGEGGDGMEVLGEKGDATKLAKFLGEESPEWAQYQEAVTAGESRKAVAARATQEMAGKPSVSRAIINSSGKNNKWVTRIAKLGRAGGVAGAVLGMADAVETIYDAEESQRLHVAAKEGAGLIGGIVGAEMGAMAAVFIVSVMCTGPGAPVILIASVVGGMVGAGVGAEVGREALDILPEMIGKGINAAVTPGSAQAGGYTGLYQRSFRHGMNQKNIPERLRQEMAAIDADVTKVDEKVSKEKDREKLDDLHAERFHLLSWRDHLGRIYGLLRTGQISDADAWKAVGGEVVEPEPQECTPEEV